MTAGFRSNAYERVRRVPSAGLGFPPTTPTRPDTTPARSGKLVERTSPGEKVLLLTRKDRILPTACVCFQFSLNNANSPNLLHSRRARRWSPPAGVTLTTRGASLNPPAHSDPCAWCARAQMPTMVMANGQQLPSTPYFYPAPMYQPTGQPYGFAPPLRVRPSSTSCPALHARCCSAEATAEAAASRCSAADELQRVPAPPPPNNA